MNAVQIKTFWSRVKKTKKCWLWTGTPGNFGYGVFKFDGKNHYAHRLAWVLHHGPVPRGLCVLHECDVPNCVRHLFLGTRTSNNEDKHKKGRHARGYLIGKNLTPESVKTIREKYLAGGTKRGISKEMNLTLGAVCHVLKGRCWGWYDIQSLKKCLNRKPILRRMCGEELSTANLNESIIRDILKMSKNMSGRSIAKKLGISKSNIGSIIARKTWKHVKLEE